MSTAPARQHLVPRQQVRGLGVGPVEAVLHAQRAASASACSAASSTATISSPATASMRVDDRASRLVPGQPDGAQHLVALQVDDVAALREDGDAAAVERGRARCRAAAGRGR